MSMITGALSGTDYGDNTVLGLTPGAYTYTLTNNGPGRLAFKVEVQTVADLGDSENTKWHTIEEKSKIADRTDLKGDFTVGVGVLSRPSVRFNFNREFLSKKTSYKLVYQPR
jgi:hypothetical protein